MIKLHRNPGFPGISYLSSAYGSTVLGNDSPIRRSMEAGGNPNGHPTDVAGNHVTTTSPLAAVTNLVSGFVNGLVEHIADRVAAKLAPQMIDVETARYLEWKAAQEQHQAAVRSIHNAHRGAIALDDLRAMKADLEAEIKLIEEIETPAAPADDDNG